MGTCKAVSRSVTLKKNKKKEEEEEEEEFKGAGEKVLLFGFET